MNVQRISYRGLLISLIGIWAAGCTSGTDFLSEAAAFSPGAAYKDQIDACSRAYAELVKNTDPEISIHAPTLILPD